MLIGPASAGPVQDNTKVNKPDRQEGMPTADQGKNNTPDRELMSRIRKSVVDDKDLSSYGHNCKIIAQHGKVTLRGPVRSEEERRAIEQKAREVAGEGNVDNQLTVKPMRNK
jgi:osmotically-inducible protein OsmY